LQTTRPRKSLYAELLFTVGLFVIPSFLNALSRHAAPDERPIGAVEASLGFGSMILTEILFIGLLFHVLKLNGEGLDALTRPIERRDAWQGLLLFGLGFVLDLLVLPMALNLFGGDPKEPGPQNSQFMKTSLTPLYVMLMVVNPFFEEFTMRGFLQTRLRQCGWGLMPIVFFSAGLQGAYHLYQGLPYAVTNTVGFLVWAILYERTRRLWLIVGAHLFHDQFAMWSYST